MNDQKNTILFIVLSAIILFGWEWYFAPRHKEPPPTSPPPITTPAPTPGPTASAPTTPPSQAPSVSSAPTLTREQALAQSPRIAIETPRLAGSIALKGGRIDDLLLTQYRETVDPSSPPIVLLSPSGSPNPFYAEFGWVAPAGSPAKKPDENTLWTQQGAGPLGVDHPVTLVWDNGEGLEFRRTISVDDKYMFTIEDRVVNRGGVAVSLNGYGLISRHGTPPMSGYAVRHEGPVAVLGDDKCLRQSFSLYTECHEESYKTLEDKKSIAFKGVTHAWFGFTDAYWAATLIPEESTPFQVDFSGDSSGTLKTYQSDYINNAQTVAPGGMAINKVRLFAGAREVAIVEAYNENLGLNHFDLLIDWGRLYFVTKAMFWSIDWIYRVVGNFGVAILIVTVLIKIIFFPLANKSYASMAKMKAVQPEMMAIRERFADDKVKQQQAMMELYRKEKINPAAGCLPILIQVPVFYALYKVLAVTIEMRHAPFFGWIHDLSGPDPSNVFTLFGLIPFDPTVVPMIGSFLHLGAWPLIMGVTMWVQMKLNPPPPDPTQQMMFNWMPVIFTFMLASFSAGLVIYWAWNNTLSVIQQSVIMRRHGAKIELFDNIKALFAKRKRAEG